VKPLLVTADLTAGALAALDGELGYQVVDRRGEVPEVALGDGAAAGAVGWVLEAERCGDDELAALPALGLVACVRGGPVNVDIDAATRRGIPVLYTPGRNAESVADFVIGQIIALVRHIAHTHHLLRSGVLTEARDEQVRARKDVIWRPADPTAPVPYRAYRGPELRTLTLGLLGLGRAGKRVAVKARALDMRVIAHDPFIAQREVADVELVGLDELLAASDVINTARAAILDHGALLEALREGHLGGAALDVFPDEPLTPGDPLLALDNVLLTPHIAGASMNVVDHYSLSLVNALRALHGHGDIRDISVANPETLAGWKP
jgi:D-3-phosphoglycerate dehydrogenase / 2-oxoglutarate reductase